MIMTNLKIDTENWSDQDCLGVMSELFESRVKVRMFFTGENEDGFLTHQILALSCGEYEAISDPQLLAIPFKPLLDETAVPEGETIQ